MTAPLFMMLVSLLTCFTAGQVTTTRSGKTYKNYEATFNSGRLHILVNGRASVIDLSSVSIPESECGVLALFETIAAQPSPYPLVQTLKFKPTSRIAVVEDPSIHPTRNKLS